MFKRIFKRFWMRLNRHPDWFSHIRVYKVLTTGFPSPRPPYRSLRFWLPGSSEFKFDSTFCVQLSKVQKFVGQMRDIIRVLVSHVCYSLCMASQMSDERIFHCFHILLVVAGTPPRHWVQRQVSGPQVPMEGKLLDWWGWNFSCMVVHTCKLSFTLTTYVFFYNSILHIILHISGQLCLAPTFSLVWTLFT